VEISLKLRRQLAQQVVYLDGVPARIIGVRLPFARVVTFDGVQSAEWSWSSAVRICSMGGHFQT